MDTLLSMYKLLFSSDFGLWSWEPENDRLYFNTAYMTMLGYSQDTFPFHLSTWERLIHPDDRDQIVQTQKAIVLDPDRGDSFEARFRMRTANGNYVWILGRGFVLCRNAQGVATRISGMHIDLNTFNETLEHLATDHDRMSFALEAARDGLWDWDAATDSVYFSPRYISMLGYTPEQFPPHISSWSSRVHPDDLEATVKKQYLHIADPETGDLFECVYRFLGADGSYKWILGRGKVTRRDADGKGTRVVGLHTDITELRAAQETLSQLLNLDTLTSLHSRYFFDAALESLQPEDRPVSIIYGDLDGLKLVNDHLGHATGDKLLIAAARILQESVGRNTVVARLGGDEFAVLLRGCPLHKAEHILKKIHHTLDQHNARLGSIPVFISLGLFCAEESIPAHKLLALADKAMLASKNQHGCKNKKIIKEWILAQTGKCVTDPDHRVS